MRRYLWLVLLLPTPLLAELAPEQVALLVNRNEPAAAGVAEHYLAARHVPAENVLTVDVPLGETLSRDVYDRQLLPAVRAWFAEGERYRRIRCLLLIYGLPLRVGPRTPTAEQAALVAKLKPELDAARAAVKANQDRAKALRENKQRTDAETAELAELDRQLPGLSKAEDGLQQRVASAAGQETNAALDSELALALWPRYETYRWVINPLYFAIPEEARKTAPPVLLTARLDGPTPETAKRLVDDAVATERDGLKGKVYIDARGIRRAGKDWYGYGGYDESFRELAAVLKAKTSLEVVLDDQPALFAAGACPDVALYCGWYSLANYVDAFTFNRGAVAWHLASAEATTLKDAKSNVWCKRLLEHGVAATLGPVNEPYTIGFPKPYEFFVTLLTGKYSLVETYFRTAMLDSWMTTLIGDPLYNPYRGRPLLSEDLLRLSPEGAPTLWKSGED